MLCLRDGLHGHDWLINMQVVESKDVGGICCALTRLGCEVGMPKLFLIDQDSGIMATMRDA